MVLGIRGIRYDLGLGRPPLGLSLIMWEEWTRSSLGSPSSVNWKVIPTLQVCWKTGSLFLSLFQFIFLSKLSICLRFDYTIICLIHHFVMKNYVWTLIQTNTSDTIKSMAHYCEMQIVTAVQSSGPWPLSLSYIWPPTGHISVQLWILPDSIFIFGLFVEIRGKMSGVLWHYVQSPRNTKILPCLSTLAMGTE